MRNILFTLLMLASVALGVDTFIRVESGAWVVTDGVIQTGADSDITPNDIDIPCTVWYSFDDSDTLTTSNGGSGTVIYGIDDKSTGGTNAENMTQDLLSKQPLLVTNAAQNNLQASLYDNAEWFTNGTLTSADTKLSGDFHISYVVYSAAAAGNDHIYMKTTDTVGDNEWGAFKSGTFAQIYQNAGVGTGSPANSFPANTTMWIGIDYSVTDDTLIWLTNGVVASTDTWNPPTLKDYGTVLGNRRTKTYQAGWDGVICEVTLFQGSLRTNSWEELNKLTNHFNRWIP